MKIVKEKYRKWKQKTQSEKTQIKVMRLRHDNNVNFCNIDTFILGFFVTMFLQSRCFLQGNLRLISFTLI